MIELDEFDIPRRVYLKLLFLNTPVYLGLLVLVTYMLGFSVIGVSWAFKRFFLHTGMCWMAIATPYYADMD